mgnify:CR=1 FL=1
MNEFTPPTNEKKGLPAIAIIAIVLGSVAVVAVILIALLIALLLPAISRARDAAMQARHQVNARSIAMAIEAYEADNSTQPPLATWDAELIAQGLITQGNIDQLIDGAPSPAFFFVPDTVLDAQTGGEREFIVYAHPDTFSDGGVLVRDDGSTEFMANPGFTDLVGRMRNPDGTAFEPHVN